jgi:O-antigen ligase
MLRNYSKIEFIVPLSLISVTLSITPFSSYDPINLIKLVCISIGGAFSFWAIWLNKRLLLLRGNNFITFIIIFYVSWSILSYFFSGVPKLEGLYGVFGRNTGLISVTSLALLMLLAVLTSSKQNIKLISSTLIFSGFFTGCYGFIQSVGLDPYDWTTEYTPVFGFFGNPNFQSSFMALTATSAILLVFDNKSWFKKFALLFIAVLSIFNIYETDSRQGLVIFLITVSIGLSILLRRKFNSVIFDTSLILVFAGGLTAILMDLLRKSPWQSLIYEESVSYRGDFWRAAWDMTTDNAIFGVGPGGFRDNYMRYRDQVAASRPFVADITDSAHNYFLDIASTGGIPLFLAYALINVLVLTRIIQILNQNNLIEFQMIVVIVCWIGFSIQSLISIENLGLNIWGWVLAGFIIGYKLEDEPKVKFKDSGNYFLAVSLLLLALFLTGTQFKNDSSFRSAVEKSDVVQIKQSGLNWPQDTYRMNFISKILRENGFEAEGLEVVKKSIGINSVNVESWRELSRFNSIIPSEKSLAEKNIEILDPFGSKSKGQQGSK